MDAGGSIAAERNERQGASKRTVGWMAYWGVVLVVPVLAVAIAVVTGDLARAYWLLRVVFRLLPGSFVLLWILVGSPPGYPALGYYRTRISSSVSADAVPSSRRTVAELVSASTIGGSFLAVFAFAEPTSSRGGGGTLGWAFRDRSADPQALAESIGLVSDPTPWFLLAVVGLVFGALSWFVVWIAR